MAKLENELFTPSGCLSRKAFIGLSEGSLSESDRLAIQRHIESCPFCQDAMEGWSMVSTDKLKSTFVELDKQMLRMKQNAGSGKNISRQLYIGLAAAASIIILLGTYFLFQTRFADTKNPIAQNIQKQPEVSAPMSEKAMDIKKEKTENLTLREEKSNSPKTQPLPIQIADNTEDRITETEELMEMGAPVQADEIAANQVIEKESEASASARKSEEAQPREAKKELAVYRTSPPTAAKAARSSSFAEKSAPENKEETVFYMVEQPPTFQGGDLNNFYVYILKTLVVPSELSESAISGKIITTFTINTQGKITDLQLIRGIDTRLDSAVLDVIRKSPDWKPGKQSGKPVNVKMTMPIRLDFQK